MNELKEIKLNKLEELASDYEIILREELNIPIATNITYSINTRAKKRYGMCSLEDKYYTVYHIEISSFLLDNEIDDFLKGINEAFDYNQKVNPSLPSFLSQMNLLKKRKKPKLQNLSKPIIQRRKYKRSYFING